MSGLVTRDHYPSSFMAERPLIYLGKNTYLLKHAA